MSDTTQIPGGAQAAANAQAGSWAPGMLACVALGWLLVTLGIWGACGCTWWIWPLSIGLAFVGLGGLLWWIEDRRVAAVARLAALEVTPHTTAPTDRQRPVPISSARGERPA